MIACFVIRLTQYSSMHYDNNWFTKHQSANSMLSNDKDVKEDKP